MGLGPEGRASRRRLCGLSLLACSSLWLWIAGGGSRQAFVLPLGGHPEGTQYDKSWPHGGLLDKSWSTGGLLDAELYEQLSAHLREHRQAVEPKARTISERLWKAAERFNFSFCSLFGARYIFSGSFLTEATVAAPGHTFMLAAASAFLTAFGGGTQSKLLHWLVARVRGNSAPLPKFAWQQADPHIWTTLGLAVAAGAYLTGLSDRLGPLMHVGFALNMGVVSGLAVVDSGWLSGGAGRTQAAASEAQGRSKLASFISVLGVLLYTSGGGIVRDLLSHRVPGAFAAQYVVPLLSGTLLCLAVHEHADKRDPKGATVLAAGIPAASWLAQVLVLA